MAFDEILEKPPFTRVKEQAKQIAPQNVTVMILGEVVGKELLKGIH